MPFTANIAVEQEVIVAAILDAFFYIYTPAGVNQHTFIRSRVVTLVKDNDSRSWSTKRTRIYDVDLTQLLSDWLTYASDNVKARGRQRLWKMVGFYVIKRYEMWKLHMSSKQICVCLTFDLLSLHKVWK